MGSTFRLESRVTEHRALGADRAYRFLNDGEIELTGWSSGRLLSKPAEFHDTQGRLVFSIAATRAWFPTVWLASGPTEPIVRFRLSSRRRGATKVEDLTSNVIFDFRPDSTLAADVVRAVVLAHTDTFLLIDGENVLGTTGAAETPDENQSPNRKRVTKPSESGFHHAETLTILSDDWSPSLVLAAATLLFKDQVIDFVRSP